MFKIHVLLVCGLLRVFRLLRVDGPLLVCGFLRVNGLLRVCGLLLLDCDSGAFVDSDPVFNLEEVFAARCAGDSLGQRGDESWA